MPTATAISAMAPNPPTTTFPPAPVLDVCAALAVELPEPELDAVVDVAEALPVDDEPDLALLVADEEPLLAWAQSSLAAGWISVEIEHQSSWISSPSAESNTLFAMP